MVIVAVGGSDAGLKRKLRVEVPDALQVSIHDDRDGVVANHHVCLPAIKVPERQGTALLVELEEALDHLVGTFGLRVREERMGSAESVPQGEGRVIRPALRLVNLAVGSHVRTIDVAIDSRGEHGVIQRGVEDRLVVGRAAFYLNLAKLGVPVGDSLGVVVVEVILRSFRLEIQGCALHADAGQGGGYENLLVFLRIEVEAGDVGRANLALLFRRYVSLINLVIVERAGEAGLEIDVLLRRPALGDAIATDGAGIDYLDVGVEREVPVHRLL